MEKRSTRINNSMYEDSKNFVGRKKQIFNNIIKINQSLKINAYMRF